MRHKLIAGNWKMHKTIADTERFINELKQQSISPNSNLLIAPPFVNLPKAVELCKGSAIEVAAQNVHHVESGAFTGEVSANMLTSIGVKVVVIGHSERRAYFNETNDILAEKVNTALKHGMAIIFCIGELLEDRTENNHFKVVEAQLRQGLFHLEKEQWTRIMLAYEPVWAIGTGETATPDQAQEMHAHIRSFLDRNHGNQVAQQTYILYGGSLKPQNAKEILSKPDVDGGLIGGASLNVSDFTAIANAV